MPNLPVMGYDSEKGATFQELPDQPQILRKKKIKLLMEIEKKEIKKTNKLSKITDELKPAVISAGRARAVQVEEINLPGN